MSRHDTRHENTLPPLQTPPLSNELQQYSFNYLPSFMLSKDIPDMSSVAQRVGAYQSRREQMIKADSGLRGWLVQVQQSIPPNLPQRTLLLPDLTNNSAC